MTGLMFPKERPRVLDKQDRLRARRLEERAVRRLIVTRDRGRCRVCGQPGYDMHELVPRSRGGRPSTRNSILVCRGCHRLLTGHAIKVYGDDGNQRLRFERIA